MATQNESLTLTSEQKREIENLFNFNSKWATKTQGESFSVIFAGAHSACVTIVKMLEILGVSGVEASSGEVDGVVCERISLN